MANVTVLFFARYAELAGCASAAETLPGARALPERPLTAVNLRQVKLSAPVQDGDEVAFLPPVAGG